MKRIVSSMMMVLLLAGAASAATYVWTGSVSTNFSDAANWLVDGEVPATPPANSDTTDVAVLPSIVTANQPVLTASHDVRGLMIEGAGWTFKTGAFNFRVGPNNIGVTTTYASGTSTIEGNLHVGTADTARTCWSVAAGGTLRIDGTIARYGSGGGATRKDGDGILELNTGTTSVNGLIINGGTVRAVNSSGGLNYTPLTLTKGTYDLNGNSVNVVSLNGTTQSRVVNNGASEVLLTSRFQGNQTLGTYLSGNFRVSYTQNGSRYTVNLANPTNDYTGSTTLADNFILVLQADSPLGAPGCLGLSTTPVSMGDQSGNGGGSYSSITAVLTDGPYVVGQSFNIGTHGPRKQLGASSSQAGTSTFSGNVRVGLGSAYNAENPHLYIVSGTNAWVNFTGNIVNATIATGKQRIRSGRVVMYGPGGARLSGENTYSGGTIVSNGILVATSPTALGTGGATVAGGILAGTATVAGAVTVKSGGSLSAGDADATGTLTLTGGLTMDAGSRLFVELSDAAADCIVLDGGALALADTVTVDVEAIATPEPVNRRILDWGAAASASASLEDFVMGAGADAYTLRVFDNALWVRPIGAAPTLLIVK